MKPIDKASQGEVSEYAGRNDERTSGRGSENCKPGVPSCRNYGEGRRLPRRRIAWGHPAEWRAMARVKGMGVKQGRAPRPAEKDRGSKVAEQAKNAKLGEGESLADGPVVAMKRGNACRAKWPYRRDSSNKVRHECDDKRQGI